MQLQNNTRKIRLFKQCAVCSLEQKYKIPFNSKEPIDTLNNTNCYCYFLIWRSFLVVWKGTDEILNKWTSGSQIGRWTTRLLSIISWPFQWDLATRCLLRQPNPHLHMVPSTAWSWILPRYRETGWAVYTSTLWRLISRRRNQRRRKDSLSPQPPNVLTHTVSLTPEQCH